jgi:hypothetical protein
VPGKLIFLPPCAIHGRLKRKAAKVRDLPLFFCQPTDWQLHLHIGIGAKSELPEFASGIG